MKKIKNLLICTLVLAIFVCGACISALAADGAAANEEATNAAVLEKLALLESGDAAAVNGALTYLANLIFVEGYAPENEEYIANAEAAREAVVSYVRSVYRNEFVINEVFDGMELGAAALDWLTVGGLGGMSASIAASGENKLLTVTASADEATNGEVSISVVPAEAISGINISAGISASGGVVTVLLNGANDTGDVLSGIALLTLDFSGTDVVVTAHTTGFNGSAAYVTVDNHTVAKNTAYTLSLIYNADTCGYTVSLTDTEGNAALSFNDYGVLAEITSASIDVTPVNLAGASVNFDNLVAIGGYDVVDVVSAEPIVDAVISYYSAALAGKDAELAEYAAELITFLLLERDYAPASATAIANAALAKDRLVNYYFNAFRSTVYAFNKGDTYLARAAQVEKMDEAYGQLLDIEGSSVDSLTYLKAVSIYQMAKDDVRVAYEDSEALIKLFDGDMENEIPPIDTSSNVYQQLLGWIKAADLLDYDPTYQKTLVSGKVVYLSQYVEHLETFREREKTFRENAVAFMAVVDAMKVLTEPDDFEQLYALYGGYTDAEGNYVKGASQYYFIEYSYTDTVKDENGDDVTRSLVEYKAAYDEIKGTTKTSGIARIEYVSTAFLAAIKNASNATVYSARDSYLKEAFKYLAIEETTVDGVTVSQYVVNPESDMSIYFPGVKEAIDLYAALYIDMINDATNAQLFVLAIDALKNAETYYEIKAAIAEAKSYDPDNILRGLEGFDDALSYLVVTEAEIFYLERNGTFLIDTVNKIESATTRKERYQLITEAIKYSALADAVVDGVGSANARLAVYIADYNASIVEANRDVSATVVETVKLAALPTSTGPVCNMVAVVKKYFD